MVLSELPPQLPGHQALMGTLHTSGPTAFPQVSSIRSSLFFFPRFQFRHHQGEQHNIADFPASSTHSLPSLSLLQSGTYTRYGVLHPPPPVTSTGPFRNQHWSGPCATSRTSLATTKSIDKRSQIATTNRNKFLPQCTFNIPYRKPLFHI